MGGLNFLPEFSLRLKWYYFQVKLFAEREAKMKQLIFSYLDLESLADYNSGRTNPHQSAYFSKNFTNAPFLFAKEINATYNIKSVKYVYGKIK